MWGKIDKTVNGHITLDTYLVFDKAEVTSENHSLVNGKIDIDEYIYRFHKDLWGVSDAHAQAERDLDKYLDALIAYTKNIIEHMFDSCTFDVTKTSYTSNIIVTPDGVARVFADVDIEFNGTNPRLQKSELGAEMKKRLQERHSEGLAGIADELIHINTFMDITRSLRASTVNYYHTKMLRTPRARFEIICTRRFAIL